MSFSPHNWLFPLVSHVSPRLYHPYLFSGPLYCLALFYYILLSFIDSLSSVHDLVLSV